ncbi:hypothetical protein EG328_004324, partial [Venturia inaequalis]
MSLPLGRAEAFFQILNKDDSRMDDTLLDLDNAGDIIDDMEDRMDFELEMNIDPSLLGKGELHNPLPPIIKEGEINQEKDRESGKTGTKGGRHGKVNRAALQKDIQTATLGTWAKQTRRNYEGQITRFKSFLASDFPEDIGQFTTLGKDMPFLICAWISLACENPESQAEFGLASRDSSNFTWSQAQKMRSSLTFHFTYEIQNGT